MLFMSIEFILFFLLFYFQEQYIKLNKIKIVLVNFNNHSFKKISPTPNISNGSIL